MLAAAYPDLTAIRELAKRAGLSESTPPPGGSAHDAWALQLATAGASGRVLYLMAEVFQDDRSREFRTPLLGLLAERRRVVDAIRSIRFGLAEPPADGAYPFAGVAEGGAVVGDHR